MSRSRLLSRAVLLAAGGAFMLWKAYGATRAARTFAGGDALLLRIAMIEALVGVLALGAAAIAAAALRPRRRRRSLDLHDPARRRP